MSHLPYDEAKPLYHTLDEAIKLAKSEVLRSYEELEGQIRYVAYVDEFYDYCLCEFIHEPAGWVKTYRALTPGERLPTEQIRDEVITRLAKAGNMVAAIRLYRTKHQVALKEAFDAVQRTT
jgi:hypothetical protein